MRTVHAPATPSPATRLVLPLLLAGAYLLRLFLVWGGGQGFWPDEMRYHASGNAAHHAFQGNWDIVARELLGHPDHVLFRVVGLPPALVEHFIGLSPALVGAYFALFSTALIALTWLVCRRAGGTWEEANWAAFFVACANSLFYFARHSLPYDASLCAVMLAVWTAWGLARWQRSFLTGVWVAVGFLIYNGYWLPGGAVLIAYSLLRESDGWGGMARRAVVAGLGLVTPIALWLLVGHLLEFELVEGLRRFGGTITRGDFGLGYRVVVEYLWASEGFVVLGLLAFSIAGWAVLLRGRFHARRFVWWGTIAVFLLTGWIVFSDVLAKFVVYGRLVRVIVPFLCLAAAFGVAQNLSRVRPALRQRMRVAVVIGFLVAAGVNLRAPLVQTFLPGFRKSAAEVVRRDEGTPRAYRLVCVQDFWEGLPDPSLPPHEELLRSPHPLQYRPHQYESHNADERTQLRGRDMAMRLVRLTETDIVLPDGWNGYPGPLRLRLHLPNGPIGQAQPLVSSGDAGRADLFYVRLLEGNRVAFGIDHWALSAFETEPLEIAEDRTCEVLVSFGALYPAEGDVVYEARPETVELRRYSVIALDGQFRFVDRRASHPSHPKGIALGVNLAGGSVVAPTFTGDFLSVEPAALEELIPAVPAVALPALREVRGPGWGGRVGPIGLNLRLPVSVQDRPQPLLSVGDPGDGELLLVLRRAQGLQFGYERSGQSLLMSPVIPVDPDAVHRIEVFARGLLPPAGSALYQQNPLLRAMANMLYVRLGGQPVFGVFTLPPNDQEAAPRVSLGANTSGMASSAAYLGGRILSVEAVALESFGDRDAAFLSLPVVRDARWAGYPGPLKLKLVLPTEAAGRSEPLIVAGGSGLADFLYVRYLAEGQIAVGYDHWGAGGPLSDPIAVSPGETTEFVVSLPALMPPPGHDLFQTNPTFEPLRREVQVRVNGQTVLAHEVEAYVHAPEAIRVGLNPAGGSSCAEAFTGLISGIERVPPDVVLSERVWPEPDPVWTHEGGAVAVEVRFPPMEERQTNTGEPIVTTGTEGAGDFVLVQHAPDGTSRIGFDHWGRAAEWSPPLRLDPERTYRLVVSHDALYPPTGDGSEATAPPALRGRCVVLVDGETVIDVAIPAHSATPVTYTFGRNTIGGSTTAAELRGFIVKVEPAAPEVLAAAATP